MKLLPRFARPIVDRLVAWDKVAAQRPTAFVANSRNVAERVRRCYGREAEVLHCPVDVDRFTIGRGAGDYYFIASRLLPYKRIDLAIRAAQLAGVKLLVAGTGPSERALRELARGTTTTMLGYVDDAKMNASARRRARRRSFRERKTSVCCRSKPRRPGVRRSRCARAAPSRRSSKVRPADISTNRRPNRSRARCASSILHRTIR